MYEKQCPLVSIWCLTYNHEKYIGDALEGFLCQKTKFPFEIIIHNDASEDKTIEILQEYEKKYPSLIRTINQKSNIYSQANFLEKIYEMQFNESKGKYVAFCEGDDYWSDENKLQMQIEYLELHTECVMVIHNAIEMDCQNRVEKPALTYLGERDLTPEEVIMQMGGAIPSASMVIRKELLLNNKFGLKYGVGDWPIQLIALKKGTIHYLDNQMSVYRKFGEGSWSAGIASDVQKKKSHFYNMLSLMREYNLVTQGMFKRYVTNKAAQFFWAYVDAYVNDVNNIDTRAVLETKKFEAKIDQILEFMRMDFFLGEQIRYFISQHKRNVIYGTGKLGMYVTQQLEEYGIVVDGYVVSDDQKKTDEFLGKPIWNLKEIPFDSEELGIIGAVNLQIWSEVKVVLSNMQYGEYIYSFVVYEDKKRMVEQLVLTML